MPLRRTPPKANTFGSEDEPCAIVQTTPKAESVPNLAIPEYENITTRKRKLREEDIPAFMDEIRELLKSHTTHADSKLESLHKAMAEIIAQNGEIKEKMNCMSKQYGDMVVRVENLEAERKLDHSYINQLEDRVENLERVVNLSKVEIRNIPKLQDETKEDLRKIVSETATALGITVQRQEIKDLFRLHKKEGVSPIIVEFTNVNTKEDILKGARNFNKTNKENKLNTSHIKIDGPSKPIFLSESLTPKAQHLFYLARKFAKDNGYKFCWTSLGKVFLRRIEGDKQMLIRCETDIDILSQAK